MGEKESVINGLKKFLKNLSKNMNIDRIFLFGSRASGEPDRDSDIDLIIVSPDFRGTNFIERGAKMYDYWTLNYPVDFLCYTPEEFNELKKQITIVKEAVENGIEIMQ